MMDLRGEKSFILILFSLLFFSSLNSTANDSVWRQKSQPLCTEETSLKTQAFNILEASCNVSKNSLDCKSLYSQMDANASDPKDVAQKKLTCSKKELERQSSFMRTADLAIACGAGIIVDPVVDTFVDVGTLIGETAASATMYAEKMKECNKSLDKKKALIAAFNLDVPKALKVENITVDELNKLTCLKLKAVLYDRNSDAYISARRKSLNPKERSKLTRDEKDILNYVERPNYSDEAGSSQGLWAMVEKARKAYNIKIECYPPAVAMRLNCEIAGFIVGTIAFPATASLRAAKLAKLSGLKVEEFVRKVNAAERAGLGITEKIVNVADKEVILKIAGAMSREERISSFEHLLGGGRKLSKPESDQLMKMHNVGTDANRGFFELTKTDLEKKLTLAREINAETGKPFFTGAESKVLMRNGITGIMGKEGLRVSGEQKLADGFLTGKMEDIETGYKSTNQYYSEYLKLPDKEFRNSVGALGPEANANSVQFYVKAATGGMDPADATKLASRLSEVAGGDRSERLLELSNALENEAKRIAEYSKAKGFSPNLEFREYLIKENKLKLQDEAYTKRYGDKYNELDYEKFESADPKGFAEFQNLRSDLSEARKASQKKRWPYKHPTREY